MNKIKKYVGYKIDGCYFSIEKIFNKKEDAIKWIEEMAEKYRGKIFDMYDDFVIFNDDVEFRFEEIYEYIKKD